jgi:multidrug transporter EmrE-like cation transporter
MIVCVITCTIQSPFKKIYQGKSNQGTFLFTSMIQLVAACFFAGACLVGGGFSYEWGALPYSLLFAFATSTCCITSVLSLRYGPLALTALFSSYSLMLPTLYGFIRFKNPVFVSQLIGIAFLLVSLYLTNMGKKDTSADAKKQKGNFKKWLPLVIIMSVTNGMCAITQTEQQHQFNGAYKNEFMMIALLVSFAVLVCVGILKERNSVKTVLKLGAIPAVLTGASNGATNLLVMICTATIAASVFFPVISGGGMVLSYIISVTLFKEKFTVKQKIGILLGVISLVFLNLQFGALGSL